MPAAPSTRSRAERRAVAYVMAAAVLFAVCNVAWRFGEGSTTAVVAMRAGLGILGILLIALALYMLFKPQGGGKQ